MKLSNVELESEILAAMLNNQDCLVTGLAELSEEDFFDLFHRHVFKAISQMFHADLTVNAVTVYERIKAVAKGNGTSWMVLKDAFWPPGTFEHHADKLKKHTKARQLARKCQDTINAINNTVDIDEVAATHETEICALSANNKAEPIITPKEQAIAVMDVVAKRMDEKGQNKSCIFTSIQKLNYATGGFEAGDLVIISGPTGGGKTAFTMNLMRDIAMIQKLPCLYINTEMSKEQMAMRWASILSKDWGVNNRTIRAGEISQEQYSRLSAEIDPLFNGGMYSITIPDLTIPKMLSTIRRFAMQKKIRAVAIDYIGRMDMMANKEKDDWKLLISAAQKLKTIGQQYGLVSLMLSQVDSNGKLALAKYMQHEADLHLHIRPIEPEEHAECLKTLEGYWNYSIVIEKGRSAPKGFIPVRFAGEKLLFISEPKEAEFHARMVEARQEHEQGANPQPAKRKNRRGERS